MKSVVINITNKCNLNCIYCFWPQKDDKNLSLENILNLSKSPDSKYIVLTWWEPLLHPDILNIIKGLHNIWKKVILHTNWLLLDQQFISITKEYLYRINLPLDSIDEQINSKLRWIWHMKKVLENIDFIKDLWVKLSITTTLTSINKPYFVELLDYIQSIKPDLWRIFEFKNEWNPKLDFLKISEISDVEDKLKLLPFRAELIRSDDKFYKDYDYKQIN